MKSVIIDRLIEIEENALKITKDAQEKEENLHTLIHQQCDKIEENLKLEYEKKAEEIKKQKEQEMREKIAEIEKSSVTRTKKLDEYFNENHEEWENEIFSLIIGG